MKTDKLLHLVQQKKAMRSGGALPLPKAQTGKEVYIPVNETTATPLSPPKLYNIPRTHKPTEGQEFFTTLGVGAIPYLGDAVDVYSAIKSAQKGDLAGTLINTTGAFLPYVAGQTLQEGWDKLGEYANNYWETKYKKQGGGELDTLLGEYQTIQDQVNKGLSEKSDYRKRVQDAAARAIKDKVVVENTDFVPQDVKNWKDPETGQDAAFCISGVCYMLNQAGDDYKYFSNTAALNDALAGKGNRTYEPDTKYTEVGDVLQFNKGEKGAPSHAALVTDLIDLPNNPGWKQVMTAMSPGKGPIKSSEYYLSPSGEIYNTPDESAVYKKNTSLLKKKFNDDSLNKTISRRDSLKAQIEKIQPGYFDVKRTRFDLNDPYMPVDVMTNPSAWYGEGDQSYVLGPGSTDRFAEQIYPKESKISEMLTKASDPDFKKQIMKDYNIGSKEYDAVIKTALGIYGTETKFGTDYWGKTVPEPQWLSKMIGYGTVGPFQLGRNNFSKELKQKYSNKDLHDPEKAFQAAVEFLAENTRNLRTKARAKPGDQYYMQNVGPDNYLDYLPYVYGAPGFLTGDKRTMKKYNDIAAGEHPYAERVKYFSNMFDVMPSSISKPVEIIGKKQPGGTTYVSTPCGPGYIQSTDQNGNPVCLPAPKESYTWDNSERFARAANELPTPGPAAGSGMSMEELMASYVAPNYGPNLESNEYDICPECTERQRKKLGLPSIQIPKIKLPKLKGKKRNCGPGIPCPEWEEGGLIKAQLAGSIRDMSKPYLNPAVVQATLASANQPVTNTLGQVISTPESREKARREKIIAKDPSKYSIEDYKKGIQEPGAESNVLNDPIAMAAMITALPGAAAAAGTENLARAFVGNLGDEVLFNMMGAVDPTGITPTALSLGTRGSLTNRALDAYERAGKQAFNINPQTGIISDLPNRFNATSKSARDEVSKQLADIGVYPKGETRMDIAAAVNNPLVSNPIISYIRNNPDVRRKLAVLTRDLNKKYNLDIDITDIDSVDKLMQTASRADEFLNTSSPIADEARSLFTQTELMDMRAAMREANRNTGFNRTISTPYGDIEVIKPSGDRSWTFSKPTSNSRLNLQIDPTTGMAHHMGFFSNPGLNSGARQARADSGALFRVATSNAPRGLKVTETSLSSDSYPLLWSLAEGDKPFRLMSPGAYPTGPDTPGGLWNQSWKYDANLSPLEKETMVFRSPNRLGKYSPYAKAVSRYEIENFDDVADVLNAQNQILEISNAGLKSQLDRGLISPEMYRANAFEWLADPSNPNAGLSITAPKIDPAVFGLPLEQRQKFLPIRIPNDYQLRHPRFTKMDVGRGSITNPLLSSDSSIRDLAGEKSLFRFLVEPLDAIGEMGVGDRIYQPIPVFEKIYGKGGLTSSKAKGGLVSGKKIRVKLNK